MTGKGRRMNGDDFLSDDTDEGSHQGIPIALASLALGALFGWQIGGDREERSAIEWALDVTRTCEANLKRGHFASVSDCLEAAVEEAEGERVDAMAEEGRPDPRR